ILANGRRHPRELGLAEVEAFLSSLAVRDGVAASTQNQALSALLFLYRQVLGIELPWVGAVTRAKRPRRLPVVLSHAEVRALLAVLDGQVALMASLLYGSGMRLMEVVRLRAKRPRRLPGVAAQAEVRARRAVIDGQVALLASLLYGSGMRLMEVVRVRVEDVDFGRREILVRNGKGGKDRRVPLPRRVEAGL